MGQQLRDEVPGENILNFLKFFVEPITGAVVKLKQMFAINIVICIAVKKCFARAEIVKSNACSYRKI